MIIKVKVKPCSREEKLESLGKDEYIAYIKERAIEGEANLALIKLLSLEFKVSYKNIKIKNPKSRLKIIEFK